MTTRNRPGRPDASALVDAYRAVLARADAVIAAQNAVIADLRATVAMQDDVITAAIDEAAGRPAACD